MSFSDTPIDAAVDAALAAPAIFVVACDAPVTRAGAARGCQILGMDRFDVMQLFVRIAESGSFTKAARAAGMAQPTASKQIAALEARLGAQLLRRTSRGLSLTEAGQAFYESAVRVLDDLSAAEQRIGRGQISPSGLVRVATSAALGRMYVVPRLAGLLARYPDVAIDLEVSERHVNLIEDGIDVAIRIGPLSDSSHKARRIGSIDIVTVAAPAYLATRGTPAVIAELGDHACVAFRSGDATRPWEFKGGSAFAPKGPVRSNDAEHIRAAVIAGLGIAHNASWLFADDLAAGTVTRILARFAPPPSPIHAVYPSGRALPRKTKVVIDFLAGVFAGEPTLKLHGSSAEAPRKLRLHQPR